MFRKLALTGLVLIMVVTGVAARRLASASQPGQMGGISYASLPDEAALYLNDMVFARDSVTLPTESVRVLLPPGTFPDTLILTENGQRVRSYRMAPQASDVYFSQAAFRYGISSYGGGGTAYSLIWESQVSDAATRAITLEYLMTGASWTPTYDMQLLGTESVRLAFFAEIRNAALVLDETTVYLVAGRVNLSQQVDQVSQVTMNQYAVGYSDQVVTLPALGVGSVDLQHVYSLGLVSAEPGDLVYANLVEDTFGARRLHVWNAAASQEVDVIYKVLNGGETPLAEGIARVYQNNLFMGSDFIETTPTGSEGSVTVGSLPDVRVRRTESQEYHGDSRPDYYLHSVALEIQNFGQDTLDLVVLDQWLDGAWQFEFSLEAVRQQDNILRWEVSIPAGEKLTITYQFRTEY